MNYRVTFADGGKIMATATCALSARIKSSMDRDRLAALQGRELAVDARRIVACETQEEVELNEDMEEAACV